MKNFFNTFRIFQAGCGGTGGYLALPLSKFIRDIMVHKNYNIKYVLYDNDVVEPKNISRQNFLANDVGKYKAEIIGTRYDIEYKTNNLTTTYIENDGIDFAGFNNVNIILGCTDSVKFRKQMSDYLLHLNPSDKLMVYIDGGNLDKSGQVLVMSNLPNEYMYQYNKPNISEIFANQTDDEIKIVTSQDSCSDLGDQTIGMNFASAEGIYNIATEFIGNSIISCNQITFRRYQKNCNYDINMAIENNSY